MTVNEYQKLAMVTLNPDLSKRDVLINGVMGLCGEAGEAIDLVKKTPGSRPRAGPGRPYQRIGGCGLVSGGNRHCPGCGVGGGSPSKY